MTSVALCKACQKPLKGRHDKKFCSDQCRSTWHNQKSGQVNSLIRRINHYLRLNRMILEECSTFTMPISGRELSERGFCFRYFTYKSIDGNFHIYDYSYKESGPDEFIIVPPRLPTQ